MKTRLFPIFALSATLLSACFPENKQNPGQDPATNSSDSGQVTSPREPQRPRSFTYSLTDSVGPLMHTEEGDKRPSLKVNIDLSLNGIHPNSRNEVEKQLCRNITGKQGCTLAEGIKQYGDSTALALSSSLESLYSDPEMQMEFPYEFIHEVKGNVIPETHPNTIGYKTETITYEGGAHGGYVQSLYNFDHRSGKFISAPQAFNMDKEEQIKTAIRNQLCADHKRKSVQELQDQDGLLVMGDVYVSHNNFVLLRDGVLFLYNPYDIGPWAMGTIEVTVPYSNLKGLCRYAPE